MCIYTYNATSITDQVLSNIFLGSVFHPTAIFFCSVPTARFLSILLDMFVSLFFDIHFTISLYIFMKNLVKNWIYNRVNWPGATAHVCTPSTLGGEGRWIT